MESFKYALVLFDHDGYTDVVECKRLKTDKPVAQALQAELWWGSKLHKVEVLMVADSEKDIDEYEQTWASSHRALALDKEKDSGKKGGYLKVWPEELENDADQTAGSLLRHKVKGKRPLLKRNERQLEDEENREAGNPTKKAKSAPRKKGKENRPADDTSATQRRPPHPKRKTARVPTNKNHDDADVDGQNGSGVNLNGNPAERRLRIEGTNGRSIAVLHEGSGEKGNHEALPNREPFFTEGLTEDQVDVIKMRLEEHKTGTQSVGTQTDKVIMFSNVEEMLEQFDPKRRTLEDLFVLIEEVRNKDLPRIVEKIQAQEVQGSIVSVLNIPMEAVREQIPSTNKVQPEAVGERECTTDKVQPAAVGERESATDKVQPAAVGERVSTTDKVQPAAVEERESTTDKVQPAAVGERESATDKVQETTTYKVQPELETGPPDELETIFQQDLLTDIQHGVDFLAGPSTSDGQAGSAAIGENTDVSGGIPQHQDGYAESSRIIHSDTDFTAYKINGAPVSPVLSNTTTTTIDLSHLLVQSGLAGVPPVESRPGTTIEIESATGIEYVPSTAEVRVSRSLQQTVKADCTVNSQFAWKLSRKIYKDEELTGRNFHGTNGKKALSPRRRKAIECAVKDTFGVDKMWLTANISGVNQGIRNMAAYVKQREQRRLFARLDNQLN